ncbi:MAG TPA: tetratricopeptide repeat protein [Xanthomonadaceae bacterium]|jgi:tetratricopeptide (TPR) repeat protein
MSAWVLTALLAITTPSAPPIEAPPEIPAQVMVLPSDLRMRVQRDVVSGAQSQEARFNKLLHLVFDQDGLNLLYDENANTSVTRAYQTHTMNCLTFTMLFIALAREAGLEAHPQEIRDTLAWHLDSDIFYRVDHVNAVIRVDHKNYLVDILRNSVMSLRAPVIVSDQRMLAHYYNNLAMEDFEAGKVASAIERMETALQLDPGYATNWSNAGVLYLHNGDEAAAEKAYAKALAIDPDNVAALNNMANLYKRHGDTAHEVAYRKHLERLQQSDPFYYFLQAVEEEENGDYPLAIQHYQRAIRMHADEPRFYASLAHAYEQAGDDQSAISALNRAKWLSTGRMRDGYAKQIEQLRENLAMPHNTAAEHRTNAS